MTPHQSLARPDRRSPIESNRLEFLWVELTNRCNMQCLHCYAGSGPLEGKGDVLQEADYRRIIAESAALGCKSIQFIGGEPTLNRSLPALTDFAVESGFDRVEVFSNLRSITDSLIANWARNGVAVATSFYSSQRKVHDRITRSIGSFERTVRNIRRVLDAGLELRVGLIEMQENLGLFEATRTFLEGLGVRHITLDGVRGFGRAQGAGAFDPAGLCGQCAGNILAISPAGAVSPCVMARSMVVGSVLESPLEQIVSSERLAEVRKSIGAATSPVHMCQPNNPFNCEPYVHCQPCAPNGGHKCHPNGNCNPGI